MADAAPMTSAATRIAWPVLAMLVALALVALLVYGVVGKAADTTLDNAVRNGKRPALPSATLALPRLDGPGTGRIADARGGVLVVNLWASWCGPCEDEAPVLQQAHARMQADGTGAVLGITIRDFPNGSRDFERAYGITYKSLRDLDNKLYRDVGSTGVPETFVLDRLGRVVAMSRGQVGAAFLTRNIARAKASR